MGKLPTYQSMKLLYFLHLRLDEARHKLLKNCSEIVNEIHPEKPTKVEDIVIIVI